MKKSHFKVLFSFVVVALVMLSCENNLEMVLPQGPQGEKGDKGDFGKSAFELWMEHFGKDPATTPIEDFFESLKGKDGKDGAVPIIGENANWWIDGEDTGIPARGKDGANGVTPEIGGNGNWFIGGVDTGKPSRGENGAAGVNGKSAYELWKEAVELCNGTVTNKDGTPYDCSKSSWEDFLIWLQGGDVSVLHRYWITLPGNESKTIQQFIEELFDCHCDGITVSVIIPQADCIELNPDGTLKEIYNAELKVGGDQGTQVEVTGLGVDLSGTIPDANTPLSFVIPRGDQAIELTITCTQSGNTVTKSTLIPALSYVKLGGEATVTQLPGEERDLVVIEFGAPLVELSVDGTVVYEAGDVVAASGWTVSNDGKRFTRTYDRIENVQTPTVQAKGDNETCSIIEDAFTIQSLDPVDVGDLTLDIVDDCRLSLSLNGTPGMTVIAMDYDDHNIFVVLTESPAGRYTTSELPRQYDSYRVVVRAELTGRGTVEKIIDVDGGFLAPVTDPLSLIPMPGVDNNIAIAWVQGRLINNTNGALTVVITRGNNSTPGSLPHPQSLAFPRTETIAPNGFVDVSFHRDYTETLAAGGYELTFVSETECGLQKSYTSVIENQEDYQYSFKLPEGSGNGDPNELIPFEVSISGGIPGSYVEFQLFNGTAYGGVSRVQLDQNGNLRWNITTMTRAQIVVALDNQKGFFYFFSNASYTNKYNIGAEKEQVTFTFENQ